MAEIKWFGHACFALTSGDVTVITDPVSPEFGYDMGSPRADIVTVSHRHPGHSAVNLVQPGYRLVNGPGEYEIQEIFITGVQTYHDNEKGKHHGKNTVYVLEIDELVIGHLGDIGHVLSDEQVEAMSSVDILMVPAGGGPVLSVAQAAEIVGQVEPSLIIPMQFQTGQGDHQFDTVDAFTRGLGIAEHQSTTTLTVRKSDVGGAPRVVVLEPA